MLADESSFAALAEGQEFIFPPELQMQVWAKKYCSPYVVMMKFLFIRYTSLFYMILYYLFFLNITRDFVFEINPPSISTSIYTN